MINVKLCFAQSSKTVRRYNEIEVLTRVPECLQVPAAGKFLYCKNKCAGAFPQTLILIFTNIKKSFSLTGPARNLQMAHSDSKVCGSTEFQPEREDDRTKMLRIFPRTFCPAL